MLERFEHEVVRRKLCTKEDHILLAVSGGVDSMTMLELFSQAGYQIGVAHANFQLRGVASDEDEKFVEKVCANLRVPFYVKRFDTVSFVSKYGVSIQVAARKLRYQWFNELMANEGYNKLATAHHLNDNIETTLLHFVRGTGITGLAGIPSKTENFIRPLLNFNKDEILNFARQSNIEWREDVSNAENKYDRNLLRNKVLPLLKELNPGLEDTFRTTNERLLGALELSRQRLDELKMQYVRNEGGSLIIDKQVLLAIDHPQVALWEMLKTYGFNYDQIGDAVKASDSISGKRFYSLQYELTIDRQSWIVNPKVNFDSSVTIDTGRDEAELNGQRMKILCPDEPEVTRDPSKAQLDFGKVQFPLLWRRWQPGDYFFPLGMTHRKKVSDFLVDIKMSVAGKDRVTVLESQGQIIWVVGHRIDNRFKVGSDTKEVIQFELLPHFD